MKIWHINLKCLQINNLQDSTYQKETLKITLSIHFSFRYNLKTLAELQSK